MVYILNLIKLASQKTQQLLNSVKCNSLEAQRTSEAACGHAVTARRQKWKSSFLIQQQGSCGTACNCDHMGFT